MSEREPRPYHLLHVGLDAGITLNLTCVDERTCPHRRPDAPCWVETTALQLVTPDATMALRFLSGIEWGEIYGPVPVIVGYDEDRDGDKIWIAVDPRFSNRPVRPVD